MVLRIKDKESISIESPVTNTGVFTLGNHISGNNKNITDINYISADEVDSSLIYDPIGDGVYIDGVDGGVLWADSVVPYSNGGGNVGASTRRWGRLYFDEGFCAEAIDPTVDNNVWLGYSSRRYARIYCVTLYQGDQVYAEKDCALCGKDFAEGDAIVSYVIRIEEDGTRCIPVHLDCISKHKKSNNDILDYIKTKNRFVDIEKGKKR